MPPRRSQLPAWLALSVLFLPTLGGAKDLAVVTHKANSVRALPSADLAKICKGQTRKWADGKDVIFVMREPESPEMKLLLQKVYGMTAEQVKALIAGANQGRREHAAILVINSDEALVKTVETTPGAMGVVDVYSITGGINVLKIDGKVPLEPGYLLHGN